MSEKYVPSKTLAVLKKISADVVVLQEVTPFWFNALQANMSSVYPYMAFMEDTHAGGMAYISKYPVNNVRCLPERRRLTR